MKAPHDEHSPSDERKLIASTPKPPYYAVVFSSLRTGEDEAGYGQMATRMQELAAEQPGYLGIEPARGDDGLGITVSYWQDLQSIRAWRQHSEHQLAQQLGKSRWYAAYTLRIARVEAEVSTDE
ncbi:MAG: antibiotic biosynthesis monooxygenase [Pirellulales bacterium]|nr:antibiotic biosynthesis monooxygenase [Pirellulales bacterium]